MYRMTFLQDNSAIENLPFIKQMESEVKTLDHNTYRTSFKIKDDELFTIVQSKDLSEEDMEIALTPKEIAELIKKKPDIELITDISDENSPIVYVTHIESCIKIS